VDILVVVTRNLADFKATGVALLNPWQRADFYCQGWPLTVPPADRCG